MRVSLAEVAKGSAALFNATSHITVAAISCTHQQQHISQDIKVKGQIPLRGDQGLNSTILDNVSCQAPRTNNDHSHGHAVVTKLAAAASHACDC